MRYRDVSPTLKASAFWLNIALSFAVALLLIALTPLIASMLDLPQLTWLIPALAISAVVGAPTVLAQASLSKDMRFKRIATIESIATLAGTLGGLVCLWLNFGLWALVAFAVIQRLAELILFAYSHHLWPQERPSFETSKDLLQFTAPLAGFQILSFMNGTVDQFFVGVTSTAQSLGQFSLARRLTQQPMQMLTFAVSRTLFPALVHTKEAGENPKDLFLSSLRLSLLIAGLPFGLIAILSVDVLYIALGPDWLPASRYLSLFAIVSSTLVMGATSSATLLFAGKTNHQFLLQLSRLICAVTLLSIVTALGGTTWHIALAMSGLTVLFLAPSSILACKALNVPVIDFGRHVLQGILPNIAICIIGFALLKTFLADAQPMVRICACTALCSVLWVLSTSFIFPETRQWLRRARGKRS